MALVGQLPTEPYEHAIPINQHVRLLDGDLRPGKQLDTAPAVRTALLSPSRRRVAYQAITAQRAEDDYGTPLGVYVVGVDGTNDTRVVAGDDVLHGWLDDARLLLGRERAVYLLDVDRRQTTIVWEAPTDVTRPAAVRVFAAPDHNTVAIAVPTIYPSAPGTAAAGSGVVDSSRPPQFRPPELFFVDISTKQTRRVAPFEDTDLIWAPDSRRIAFVARRTSPAPRTPTSVIVVMDVATTERREVSGTATVGGSSPRIWTSDNRLIAVVNGRGRNDKIVAFYDAGGRPKTVAEGALFRRPPLMAALECASGRPVSLPPDR